MAKQQRLLNLMYDHVILKMFVSANAEKSWLLRHRETAKNCITTRILDLINRVDFVIARN